MTTPEISVTIEELGPVITVSTEGVQGPPGPTGPPGSSESHHEEEFTTTSSVVVTHSLGYNPIVQVIVGDEEVIAEVIHSTLNQFTVMFGVPLSGKVIYV